MQSAWLRWNREGGQILWGGIRRTKQGGWAQNIQQKKNFFNNWAEAKIYFLAGNYVWEIECNVMKGKSKIMQKQIFQPDVMQEVVRRQGGKVSNTSDGIIQGQTYNLPSWASIIINFFCVMEVGTKMICLSSKSNCLISESVNQVKNSIYRNIQYIKILMVKIQVNQILVKYIYRDLKIRIQL